MQQQDIKDLLPLFVGAITAIAALLGVLISAYISHRNTRATLKEQRQLRADERRLERLEDLFVVFERWEMNFSQVYLLSLRRHKGLLTQQQVYELVAKLDGLEKGDIHRMSMLLRVHFPELSQEFSSVQKSRKAIVPFLDSTLKKNIEEFIKAQEHFESTAEAFKQAIADLPKLSNVRVH